MILLCFSIIFNFNQLNSSNYDDPEIGKYRSAMEYIESEGLFEIFYSHPNDTNDDIYLCASTEIINYYDSTIVSGLDCEKLSPESPVLISKNDKLKELNNGRDSCNVMIFFTKVYGNKLFSEIWHIPNNPTYIVKDDKIIGQEYPTSYKDLSYMDNYVRILFEFEEGKIVNVCYIKGVAN